MELTLDETPRTRLSGPGEPAELSSRSLSQKTSIVWRVRRRPRPILRFRESLRVF